MTAQQPRRGRFVRGRVAASRQEQHHGVRQVHALPQSLGVLVGVVADILILAVWREVWLAADIAAADLAILWLSRNRVPRNWR
jgi:hypothetical protein